VPLAQFLHQIEVPTRGKGLYEITGAIEDWLEGLGASTGLLTVFVQHTSASLIIQENADPDVVHDLNEFFNRLVEEDNRLYRHTVEGPDDMRPTSARRSRWRSSPCRWNGAAWRSAPGKASTCSSIAPAPHRRSIKLHLLGGD